jgi:acetylornithine deacetylase
MADAVPAELRARVLDRIDDDEVVGLACELIRIPSFTTEETRCAEWLAGYLDDQGLAVTVQEIEPGRKQTIARLAGTGGGRSIMLNGHIDIDPLASGWTRDPFAPWIADGKLFGHGVYNMKAGVTACVMATLALQRAGVPRRGDVVLACVAAELNSGIGTIHALEHGQRTDMAVVAEPYGARTILTKHTGTMDVVIHTLGRATHISKKEHGVDAIAMMMRAVAALDTMRFTHTHDPDLPGLPRLNVGSIIGGRGREHDLRGAYTVSDFCTAYVNVRFNASQTGETVVADIRRTLDALAAADPRFAYEIEFPPRPERGLGRLAKAAVDVPKTEPAPHDRGRARASRGAAPPELRGQRHHPPLGRRHSLLHLWPGRRLHRLPRRARGPGRPVPVHPRAGPHRARSDALTGRRPCTTSIPPPARAIRWARRAGARTTATT